MAAIILGNPTDIQTGSVVPVQVPAYTAEEAVIVLSDGYNPYIIEGGGGSSDSYWFRYTSGLLRPITITDKIVIGGTSLLNTESLRVVGKINSTSIQLGSSVTISSILDEDDLVSDSNTAVPTQQSVKAYVDSQVGGFLQSGDNISELVNDVPYLTTEVEPLFTASVAYGITSTNTSNWNTAYGWGNHASAGYLTTETDPIFTASTAYGIDGTDITHWDLAYTNNHTHSNKTLLDTLISSGTGTNFLGDDGIYHLINTTVAGSDTQIQYNNSGAFGANAAFTVNTTSGTLNTTNLSVSNTIYLGGITTYMDDVAGDLTFTDANAGSITLSSLITGATNYWSTTTGGIYYGAGTDKVGINTSTLTEALTIDGNIAATDFNSSYFKYKNSNLLLGPNAGDNETGDNLLYISNSDTATPLVKGDFINQMLEFNADTYINSVKRLCFGNSDVYLRRDGDDLTFSDLNTNSGNPVKLSDFVRDASLYALKSDFTQYSAVTSITNANKTTWNKSSILITTGPGTNYLADDGTYKAVGGGGVTPTDYTFKWDTGTSYYRPYTTKTEAGGALSAGKFYSGTDNPTATNRLNYDGKLYTTAISCAETTSTAISGYSTSGIGVSAQSIGYYGLYATSTNSAAIRSSSSTGNCAWFLHQGAPLVDVSNALVKIEKTQSGTVNVTENLLELLDNPTTSGTISGALISGTVGTTERLRFDPRVLDGASAVASFEDTHTNLTTTGAKLKSFRMQGSEKVYIDKDGNVDTVGIFKINGVDVRSTLRLKQSTGLTYNPANPFLFDNDYQYNNYTLTANITPTYSLTGAIALNGVSITFVGDGTHTVDFSNFVESDLSGTFDVTSGAENTVIFYYNGVDVFYSITSNVKLSSSTTTGVLSSTDWTTFNNKQAALVSGTNIKTINSTTILGSGDIAVQPTLVSGTNIKTINGNSVLGSGDLTIASGVTPTDNIFDWDGTNSWYAPYSSKQASMSFYTGTTDPTLTTRLNLDADLRTTSLRTNNLISYTTTGYAVSGIVSSSGYGVYGESTSGTGVWGYSTTGKGGEFRSDGTVNASLQVEHNGTLNVTKTANVFEVYRRNGSGTGSSTGNLIYINDNPSISGTISGKILTAIVGTTERISLNPRVANSGTNKAYILDTHSTLSGTTELLSIQNNTVERFRVTPSNTALPAGTSTTFATVGGVLKDFYTDVSTSGTTETDLYSYTIPANVLVNNGDKLILDYIVRGTASGDIKFYFGTSPGAVASATGLISIGTVNMKIIIIRNSSSTAKIFSFNSVGTNATITTYNEVAITWTDTNTCKITGTATSGTWTSKIGYIEYKPAAIN
jgi:hypothetical protein